MTALPPRPDDPQDNASPSADCRSLFGDPVIPREGPSFPVPQGERVPYLKQLRRAVDELAFRSEQEVEFLAHHPTTTQPGSMDRLLVYAARIIYNLPIFNPEDSVPTSEATKFDAVCNLDSDEDS